MNNPSTRGSDPTCFRIVLTGGPGGGKTTAADLFRREVGERIVVVPEAASILFSGGFPRSKDPQAVRDTQTAIYHVQRNLENIQFDRFPNRVLLCDRGTLDGAAYWPGEAADFLSHLNTDLPKELQRYDAVLFFESASAGGHAIEGGNPNRIENVQEASDLDRRLQSIWRNHPNFTFIPHHESFMTKIRTGLEALVRVIDRLLTERNERNGKPKGNA